MTKGVRKAYSRRAAEYVAALGSVEEMDPRDIALITGWAMELVGPVLDAGSGPGHWTELLRTKGHEVTGIDLVREFVDSARRRFPLASFEQGNLTAMRFPAASVGGVLAWYSLIHLQPEVRVRVCEEFARVLVPGGSLLVGAFLGPRGTPFNHAVIEAFYWSEHGLAEDLESAGFQVVSLHTRAAEGARAHISALARSRS